MYSYYSSTTLKSHRRPPLPKSPIRTRTRSALHSSDSVALQTPPGSLTKSQKPIRSPAADNLRPEYRTMSCEIRALSRMVREEFGKADPDAEDTAVENSCGASALFERGRFYDEYSARRNERLKRKKGMVMVDEGGANNNNKSKQPRHALGVTVESGKKSTARKLGSLRKSVSAAYSAEVSETPRYMLRSMTKENKKPPLAAKIDRSAAVGDKKKIGGARRVGRISNC